MGLIQRLQLGAPFGEFLPWPCMSAGRPKQILPPGTAGLMVVPDLPGPMERGLTNPARAGMQQRQFAPRPPW
jgi:hypothetical protein